MHCGLRKIIDYKIELRRRTNYVSDALHCYSALRQPPRLLIMVLIINTPKEKQSSFSL